MIFPREGIIARTNEPRAVGVAQRRAARENGNGGRRADGCVADAAR